jgi:Cu(I)/Ag(I) efflux system membrane protein CusA/SilA
MQRIAVPMIGGMISSTLLTLIVIPAIFGLVKGFRLPDEGNANVPAERAGRDQTSSSAFDPSEAAE